jgi:hypothetical protein
MNSLITLVRQSVNGYIRYVGMAKFFGYKLTHHNERPIDYRSALNLLRGTGPRNVGIILI